MRDVAGKASSSPALKLWRSPFVRIGGSAVVLALLFTFLPFRQVWSSVIRIPPKLVVGLLCAYLAVHLLGVVKWRLLINLAGSDLTFFQAVRCYYWGLFGNMFLPSLVGGDLVRGGMAFLYARSKPAVVLGSLMDRIQDLVGLLGVLAIGVLLLPGSLDFQNHKRFWTVTAVLFGGGALCSGALFVIPARKLPFKIRRVLVTLRRGVRSMYRRPGRMLLCFTIGMVVQVSQVTINYWLGEASGLHLAFSIWLFAWPLAKLLALLPITQGGLGVREAALVSLLAPFGAPPILTAAVGLAFRAIVIAGGLIGGILALLMGRFSSQTKQAEGIPEFTKGPVPNE